MIMQLGNKDGLKGMMDMLAGGFNLCADIAAWDTIPADYGAKAQKEMDEIMKNLPDEVGHTFSEMEPYNEKTAVKDATALVEMVRSYWMEQAKQAEEREKKAGTFVGFALLSDNSWDKEKYIRDLKEQWDITAEEKSDEERNPESLVFDVGDMMAAVSLMPAPVPNGEARSLLP